MIKKMNTIIDMNKTTNIIEIAAIFVLHRVTHVRFELRGER